MISMDGQKRILFAVISSRQALDRGASSSHQDSTKRSPKIDVAPRLKQSKIEPAHITVEIMLL